MASLTSFEFVRSFPGKMSIIETIAMHRRHTVKMTSMWGTLALTSSGNLPLTGSILSGLTSAVHTKLKIRVPTPKPPTIIPDTSPGLSGNQSQP